MAFAGAEKLLDFNQPFDLVLTLFDTPAASSSRLINLDMPDILKLGCGDV